MFFGTLTGQQINNTYDGLLKLSDSTTGITSSLQAVEDGLGNNTGTRIATNLLTAPNLITSYIANIKPDFMGNGAGSTGSFNPGANSQSNMVMWYFYDTGVHDYSAVTVNIDTITSTSDVVNLYFYDLQYVDQYGFYPKDLIMSGISLPVSSTGLQSVATPSTLSFSGYGGGYFCYILTYRNGGVSPTVRYKTPVFSSNNQSIAQTFGLVRNNANTGHFAGQKITSTTFTSSVWLTGDPLPSFTPADIISKINTTTAGQSVGFSLNVIK